MTSSSYSSSVFMLQGRIVSNNSVPSGASPLDGQVFHIREEGGLERWFNLTITNVGIEVSQGCQKCQITIFRCHSKLREIVCICMTSASGIPAQGRGGLLLRGRQRRGRHGGEHIAHVRGAGTGKKKVQLGSTFAPSSLISSRSFPLFSFT